MHQVQRTALKIFPECDVGTLGVRLIYRSCKAAMSAIASAMQPIFPPSTRPA